ncbi:MAG: 23S rRNA (pseudouridine(1915)-N(3))-methyltransferase RlmH [Clostridia bacterium]|nr:23S rRNA (pseudouridine(1915)-N(3))-methyltransferase RlmH [Clostridia bacterium]
MLTVTLACVGKLKERYWREACAEYEKRLGAFCRLQIIEVAEERLPDAPSPAQITAAIEAEGRRLLSHIPAGASLIALCIEGKEMPSEALSKQLSSWTVDGVSHVALVIGGSFGLSEAVKREARLRLSFSPMTFPHQLARILTLEQLYRAFHIASGGKYHK